MEMPDDWTARLADAIAAALHEFAPRVWGTELAVLSVVCLPWHGHLSLAVLTSDELVANPELSDPRTTAEWQYDESIDEVAAWGLATPLAREMRAAYYDSSDCPATAVAFLRACAVAAETFKVAEAVSLLKRSDGFRICVPHPDDEREFFPPGAETGDADE